MSLKYDPRRKYLIDIINDNIDVHEMNYELINYFIRYFEQRGVPIEINQIRYIGNPNIIETLNYYIKQELYLQDACSITAYKVIAYLIKKKMGFDIETLMKDSNFLNIIQWGIIKFSNECENKKEEGEYKKKEKIVLYSENIQILRTKIEYFEDFFLQIVDDLYVDNDKKINSDYVFDKDLFKLNMLTAYKPLFGKVNLEYFDYKFSVNNNPIDDGELDKLSKEVAEDMEKLTQQEEQGKENTETIDSEEEKEYISNEVQIPVKEPKEDEKKYDYDSMPNAFKDFIEGGDSARYRSAINYNCLPIGSPKLKMKNDSKANIARFLFCFDIPFEYAFDIFGIKIKLNDHPRKNYFSGIYSKLKEVYPPYEEKVKKFLAKE